MSKSKRKTRAEPKTELPKSASVFFMDFDLAGQILPSYKPLHTNSEIVNASDKISRMVASETIHLMESNQDGHVRVKNGLSRKIDIDPNNGMIGFNFKYRIADTLLRLGDGNCVVLPHYKKSTTGTYLLNDFEFFDMKQVSYLITDTGYQIRYQNKIYDSDEVLHFVLKPSSKSPFIGEGYAKSVADYVTGLNQANATKIQYQQKEYRPNLVITVDSLVEEFSTAEGRKKVIDDYVKTTGNGEPWLLPEGQFKVQEIKPLTLADLSIIDSISLDKKGVSSMFGIPLFMSGLAPFNRDEFNYFIQISIMPIALIIQQELTKKLIDNPNWYFKLNAKSLMQYSLNEQINYISKMQEHGNMTINEVRNVFDLSPKAGGDGLIILENYIPVGHVGDQKKLQGTTGDGGG